MSAIRQIFRIFLTSLFFCSVLTTPLPSYAKIPLAEALDKKDSVFTLEFLTPKKEVYRDIQGVFKSSGEFDDIVKSMNETFRLPVDINIKFAAGDGPVYRSVNHEILMSYDFIFHLTVLYIQRYPKTSEDALINFALRTSTFLLYHEIAHALIDVYGLPIVSNQETAADNLAVILALEFQQDGYRIVMNSAELFDLLEKDKSATYDESDYWDEHALDAQRFYNILCLAYGKYPKKVAQELKKSGNKKLSEFVKERSDYCADEYQQQLQSWSKLLNPYFR